MREKNRNNDWSAPGAFAPGATAVVGAETGATLIERPYFEVTRSQWVMDTLFLLSLSLTGLGFPLGNILVVILLYRAWQTDREGFLFKLLLTIGGYGLTYSNTQWGINLLYVVVPVSFIGMCILRKTRVLKLTIGLYLLYFLSTFIFAFISDENFRNQYNQIFNYISFCFFTIPLMAFYNEEFDIRRFWARAFTMMMILCVFYLLDGWIFRGWVLLPCTYIFGDGAVSTWNHPIFYGPFASWAPRKYPPGLYPMLLILWPIARYYRLRWWQWVLIIAAALTTRTSTTTFAFIICYLMAMGTLKRYLIYGLGIVASITAIYFIDDSMGYSGDNQDQSTLRLASTINQFVALDVAEDDEDLAEAGSGRMAQAIPAIENLYEHNKQWLGFGFIGMDTRNPRFMLYNDLIVNPELRYTSCAHVEITQVQIFLEVGWIGLIVHCLFLLGLWLIIRRQTYSGYFLNVMVGLIIYGIGGFRGWHDAQGIFLAAMAYAVVILANRNKETPQPLTPDRTKCLTPTTNG